MTEQSNLNY